MVEVRETGEQFHNTNLPTIFLSVSSVQYPTLRVGPSDTNPKSTYPVLL